MTLKDKILIDLEHIENPSTLNQIFEFIREIRQAHSVAHKSNRKRVLRFAGKIRAEDANEIIEIIDSEFNTIEGEW